MSKRKKSSAGGLPDVLLGEVAQRFQALSSVSRLKIVNALMGGALSMSELQAATGLEQSNLSRQVAELERAGCVARTRAGRTVIVEVADPTLESLCHLVCGSLKERAEASQARYSAL